MSHHDKHTQSTPHHRYHRRTFFMITRKCDQKFSVLVINVDQYILMELKYGSSNIVYIKLFAGLVFSNLEDKNAI